MGQGRENRLQASLEYLFSGHPLNFKLPRAERGLGLSGTPNLLLIVNLGPTFLLCLGRRACG